MFWVSPKRRSKEPNAQCKRRRARLSVETLEDRLVPSTNVLGYLGQDLNETVLTPANVSTATFGQAFTTALDGSAIRAQPLYVSGLTIPGQGTHNVVYVATAADNLYAIDANSGQVLWEDSFADPSAGITSVLASDFGSTDAGFGQFGIRGTPVIDMSTGSIFAVTFTRVLSGSYYDYEYQLQDVSLTTGQDVIAPTTIGETSEPAADIPGSQTSWVANWNVISGPTVQGTGAGSVDGTIQFNACAELQTAALTLADGNIYVCFSGLVEDFSDQFHGWVLGYSAQTLQLTAVWNDTPNGTEGGIWMGGASMTVDAQGDLYLMVGNGDFSNTENGDAGPVLNADGFPADGNYGDSFVKLAVDPTTSPSNENINGWGLTVVDYFTPSNQAFLNASDGDLGSSSPVLIPNPDGSAADPDLIVAAGKGDAIYVVDPDNMGKYNANADNIVQEIPLNLPAGQENQLASVADLNGTVFLTGSNQVGSAYSLEDDQLNLAAQTSNLFGYAGADPTVSADGTSDGIVWELDYGTNQLFAYAASNLSDELWASNQGTGNQFPSKISEFQAPTAANGMVYVASAGYLTAYGLLYTPPTAPSSLSATTASTSEIDLTWTNGAGTQTGVEIQRSLDGVNYTTIATVSASATSYQDTSVAANTTYYYQVVASNSGVVSSPSNEASATSDATAGTAPLAPSGLTASALAGASGQLPQVDLSWTDNNPGNETAFLIERSVNSGPYVLLEQVPSTQTTYSDLNLEPGTYSYEVLSTNAAGTSTASSPASALVPTLPVTPSEGEASAVSATEVRLSWQDNSNNETGFQIFRRTGSTGDYTLIATLAAGSTTYLDTTVAAVTTYDYQIEACNISGHAGFTGATVTTPVANTASLVRTDTTTQGTWQGSYGGDGYDLAGGSASLPAYASVSTTGTLMTWAASTTDPRALQVPGVGGVAAAWSGSTFTVTVDLTDTDSHLVSLYLLDWDNEGRSEQIVVTDPATGNVLGSETVSNFSGGEYLTWSVTGAVQFSFTALAGSNAVLSGIFFGGAASFAGTDTTTQGNWSSSYGGDGYDMAGGAVSLPSYANVQISQAALVNTWAAATTDVRALQMAGGEGQAAAWYVSSTLTVNIDLSGGPHLISLYFLDWDHGNRSEQISIIDSTTGVLDSETVSNFSGGTYLSWEITGNVEIDITSLSGPNAVLSGIFFGAAGASFVGSDTTTQGNWSTIYGGDGYDIAGGSTNLPVYATLSNSGTLNTWSGATTDPRALQSASGEGVAAAWYGTSFTVTVDLTYGPHQVALYFLDWDSRGRSELIDVVDAKTGALLDSETISNFAGGEYLTWNVTGDVEFRISTLAGPNAVLSGIFFGEQAGAWFVSTDTTTQGNWTSNYGGDGYDLVGGVASLPNYATVSSTGSSFIWTSSTTDPRALQIGGGNGLAAAWYGVTFTITIDMSAGPHVVSLYLLDWDNQGRIEEIDIVNAKNGDVLDSQTASNFSGGEYLTWILSGDVEVVVTAIHYQNAVVSAIFFGGQSGATYIGADAATKGDWSSNYGGDGFDVAEETANLPAYAQVSYTGAVLTWSADTTDPRALQMSGQGLAAAWYGATISVNVSLAGGPYQVSLYVLDWDNEDRSERIDILDATTGTLLNSQTVSNFSGGVYLSWDVTGDVEFLITAVEGPNAVLSGIFFGGADGAAFAGSDTTTQGNWSLNYGGDGYDVAEGTVSLPAYAQLTNTGTLFTWSASTTDPRALQISNGDGVAAAWYGSTFTVDISLSSGPHEISLYFLDWDDDNRIELVDAIAEATGTVLNSQTVSNFSNGVYLTWNVIGNVEFRITALRGNAVLSGIFFGGSNGASFVGTDVSTQGNWSANYGGDGYYLAQSVASFPAYASVSGNGMPFTWAASTTDPRALQVPGGEGVAAAWYGTSFTVNVDLSSGTHEISLYVLDWDDGGRVERIDVIDPNSGDTLDSETVANFSGGEYLTWNVTGDVEFRFTTLQGTFGVLSGIFFGGAAGATFIGTDTVTEGNWISNYGANGYDLAKSSTSLPAFAQVTTTGTPFAWTTSTTDPRALQVPGGGSVAAAWYGPSFTVNVNLTGGAHMVSLYLLDWDNRGRSERIDVIDPTTGDVLDSETVSNFADGEYLTWELTGDVEFRITALQGSNAVLSGIFFD